MKTRLLFFALLSAGMAMMACSQKEILPEPEVLETQETESVDYYYYTFNVSDAETKTSFGSNYVVWEENDLVGSFATTVSSAASINKSTPVTIDGSGVHITIRSSVALSAGDMVYAYYPFSSGNNKKEANNVILEIPRNQVSGSADAMPMVSLPFELTGDVPTYTNTEVGTLRFMNLGSIIKLNIFSTSPAYQGETIENVTFQAGAACAGSFSYDLTAVNESSPEAITGYEATDVVVCGDGANPITVGTGTADGGVFYIIVAPGTYSGTFVIRTNKGNYTYVSSKSRTYDRASLKPLNIDLSSANWTPIIGGYDSSIDSSRELDAFLKGTSSGDTGSYTITADLDMTGYTITSASGFGGTLDGGNHKILNLSSSVPLFASNSGTIRDLILDESCSFTAGGCSFAPLVSVDNGGRYESVINKASVSYTASSDVSKVYIMGGIVAVSTGGYFESCTNSGAITFDATGYSHVATSLGGIVGVVNNTTANATFDTCKNNGPITLRALYGNPVGTLLTGLDAKGINMGGIIGSCGDGSGTVTFESCVNEAGGILTFRHNEVDRLARDNSNTGPLGIGGIIGFGTCGTFNKCKNQALIDVKSLVSVYNVWTEDESNEKKRRNYMMGVGGIGGYGWDSIGGMSSCTNEGDIEVEYNALYTNNDTYRACLGGIAGKAGDNGNGYAYYCRQRGNITVTGRGAMAVGGIFGFRGKQIKNEVSAGCHITVEGLKGDVGGLVGYLAGSPKNLTIKGCTSAAAIFADSVWGETDKHTYYSVGGLIGRWAGGETGSYPSLTDRDSSPCEFTGSVSSTWQDDRVGFIVGYSAGSVTKVFGSSDYHIQASGSIQRKGLLTTPIKDTNIETYAIGTCEGTNTIYVDGPATPPTLKLMSFNIREGSDWNDRKSGIVSMIKDQSPDIIGLQEVKDLDYWDHLSEDHPWDYLRDKLSDYSGYRYSTKTNAILYKTSRVELTNTGIFYLGNDYSVSGSGNSWDDYERSALYGTMRDKTTGEYYFFINTHFPLKEVGWGPSCDLIENRITALNPNNYPVILMGDFNCVIGNSCWDHIKTWMKNTRDYADEYYSQDNRTLYTYNAFGDESKARNKVDHIWVSKTGINVCYYLTLTQDIVKYGSENYLSDHYPIIAIINHL